MLGRNSHFTIGVHTLTALALHTEPVTSGQLAGSVNTNPAFLRQVLGRLRDAGLIETRLGAGGGALLARAPETLTLLDVYRATEGETTLCAHACAPDATCAVAQVLPGILGALETRLDAAIARELRSITVAELAQQIRQRMQPEVAQDA